MKRVISTRLHLLNSIEARWSPIQLLSINFPSRSIIAVVTALTIGMEKSTRLTDSTMHRRKRVVSQSRLIYVDDESSTDSGCSSRGSSESNERLSRRGSADRLCETSVNTSGDCYLHRLRGAEHRCSTTRSQERLTSGTSCANLRSSRSKSSRSWSPCQERGNNRHNHHHHHYSHHHHHHHHHHHRHHSRDSPSHSSSPSDAQSSDSDSLKKPSKTEVIRRALQCLKIAMGQENRNHQNNGSDGSSGDSVGNNGSSGTPKEKKQTKKSPKRILRDPVSYTYVRGLSGLPTQRVPRNPIQESVAPCSCHDSIGLYR